MRQFTLPDETADRVIVLLSAFAGIPNAVIPQVRDCWEQKMAAGGIAESIAARVRRVEDAAMDRMLEDIQAAPDPVDRMGLCFDALHGGGADDPAEMSCDAA